MVELHPKKCNLCGGKVVYVTNDKIYGKRYGSGYCYLCQNCGAYVGTHIPRPKEALGLLSNSFMRETKMMCHGIFDSFWKGKPKASKKRHDLYRWLANEMGLPVSDCHFGYFDEQRIVEAYMILTHIDGKEMKYDNNGEIYFQEPGVEE